jgi:uncharacterized FAD-dependent dehydrogenase
MNHSYDVIIVGSGPAGLGAAFHITENSSRSVLLLEKSKISSGGLRNDCKQNYTYPVGFTTELWTEDEADRMLSIVASHLNPEIVQQRNLDIYIKRAENLGVKLLNIKQSHVGTDRAKGLIADLFKNSVTEVSLLRFETEVADINYEARKIYLADESEIRFRDIILAPGRAGYNWLQNQMDKMNISYSDNVVDVGVRIEAREQNYPIVKDYYDPKFIFPGRVRTFCTNSGSAHIVKEKYEKILFSEWHAYSTGHGSKWIL